MEKAFLLDGPALDEGEVSGGFYYDARLAPGRSISSTDLEPLEALCQEIVKAKQRFLRAEVDISVAREILSYNPHKQKILDDLQAAGTKRVTIYRCGPFIDLCRGPHITHTGLARGFKLLSASGANSKPGEVDPNPVQRVYGISFFSKEARSSGPLLPRSSKSSFSSGS